MPYLPADPPLTLRDLSGITGRPSVGVGSPELLPHRPVFLASGRAALFGALQSLGVSQRAEVLLPSYLCESVVSPVHALGARPSFYPVGRSAQPDLDSLVRSISARTRAVVVIHYFGFPAPVEEVRQICVGRGIALVEDCAHALFGSLGGRLLGSFGSAAIWSPWKSIPMPDGGLLALNDPNLNFRGPVSAASTMEAWPRLLYRSLGTFEALIGWSPRLALLRQSPLRRALHRRTSGSAMTVKRGSAISRRILEAARARSIVDRRRENYSRLLEAVGRSPWAEPLFDDLPPGVCPLGLPMIVEHRDQWRDALLQSGVNVRTYWEYLPPEVDPADFPDAAWLRDRILVLPVHQGLSSDQVAWLARLLPKLRVREGNGALANS